MVMAENRNNHHRRLTFAALLNSDAEKEAICLLSDKDDDRDQANTGNNPISQSYNNNYQRPSDASTTTASDETSPYVLSPWNQTFYPYIDKTPNFALSPSPRYQTYSPYFRSPWIYQTGNHDLTDVSKTGLISTIVRQEGHVYSLAASEDLLYTGSDSKNIRVWKDSKDFAGFKSNSGLVKTIVITGDNRIFTGHQDGKIRVWRGSTRIPGRYSRVGSLPTLKEFIIKSMNPRNYVKARRNKSVLKIRHFDAVSCLSLDEELGLLYSGSWDKTLKVWRLSDSKCLESIEAHDDAINTVAAGFDDLIFTGSADGTLKVWKRELQGIDTNHFLVDVLTKQEDAVTALAVNLTASVVYCGASDGSVNFWELQKNLSHGGTLHGHRLAVLCLASAGSLLLSGGADKNICVWRRHADGTHTRATVLTDHMGPVKCLAAVEEEDTEEAQIVGRHRGRKGDRRWIVYSGSLDKSVKVWRVNEHARL